MLKTEETQEWDKYAFGDPPARVLGQVIINKFDGQVDLVEIEHKKYSLIETNGGYGLRTKMNVETSDGTLIFYQSYPQGGTRCRGQYRCH